MAFNGLQTANSLTWKQIKILRERGMKAVKLFVDDFNIPIKKLKKTFLLALKLSSRGYLEPPYVNLNMSYEAINDIYSFLRMFRTFKDKSKHGRSICKSIEQNNIIYLSHLGHSTTICYNFI